MANLLSDLFTEILSRLPVQTLLRFRSISKSLKSLIDSHSFTNLHLKNSLNSDLVLCCNSEFYQIDFPNLTTTVSLNHPLKPFRTVSFASPTASAISLHGTLTFVNIGPSLISLFLTVLTLAPWSFAFTA